MAVAVARSLSPSPSHVVAHPIHQLPAHSSRGSPTTSHPSAHSSPAGKDDLQLLYSPLSQPFSPSPGKQNTASSSSSTARVASRALFSRAEPLSETASAAAEVTAVKPATRKRQAESESSAVQAVKKHRTAATSSTETAAAASARGAVLASTRAPPSFRHGNYDWLRGHIRWRPQWEQPRMQSLQSVRTLFADRDVLDVGCHAGRLTVRIAHELPVRSVTAIDIDPTLLLKAQELQREYRRWAATTQRGGAGDAEVAVRWLSGDALSHSFSSRFHVVLCLHVAQHVHRTGGDAALSSLLTRLTSLLHAGGVLMLQAGRAGGRGDEAATGGCLAERLQGLGLQLLHSLTVRDDDTEEEAACSCRTTQTSAAAKQRTSAPQEALQRQRARRSRKRKKKREKAAQGSRVLYVLQLPA